MSERRDAWIEIDHDALRSNLSYVRADTRPETRVCAVVKANAYGHGGVECARTLVAAGTEHLAVITLDEGLALRDAGIDCPILLLHEPPMSRIDEVLSYELTSVVFTAPIVAGLEAAAARRNATVRVHLKVDTGLHRLGVPSHELGAFLDGPLAAARHLEVEGVFTHFAFADEPANPVIDEQLHRFADALDVCKRAGITPSLVHAANSAATLNRPDAHFDMIRPGIALYGLSPGAQVREAEGLRPILSLRARVARVERIEAGAGVSYGHRWTAAKATTIASLPLGYADGWPRALATNANVLIAGVAHPAVGTVCMDSFMADCGDHPVSVGDEAVLIGTQGSATQTADELAARLGTINYEVVARLAPRLPREHLNR